MYCMIVSVTLGFMDYAFIRQSLFSFGFLQSNMQVLNDQLEAIKNTFVGTKKTVSRISRKRWMIKTNDEKESGKTLLAA